MTPRRASRLRTKPVELFVSYAHENAAWFLKVRPLLKFRQPTHVVHAWHDQELKAGDRWDDEIRAALDVMDVFVCLVSYEFLDSDYIMDVELKRAFEREQQKRNKVEIVPIVLFPMDLREDCPELCAFSPLPGWNESWSEYEKDGGYHQDAHKLIRAGLREAIGKVRDRRP